MTRIDRYIFRQLFMVTVFVAATLTCVVWLTQSLRFIEMIVNRGLSIVMFTYFTLLLLPNFLSIVLPVALLVAVLFVYNRLLTDSELVVLRAGGMSQFQLARPTIALALLTMAACYALTLYFVPASYRTFKDMQSELRKALPSVLLQEGVFNTVVDGVTVYVRERAEDGELMGVVVHDARDRDRPVTMMAERGAIVGGPDGPRVVMVNGNRQETDPDDGGLSLLYFDRYAFDIAAIRETGGARWREPRERYLPNLLDPPPSDDWIRMKLVMEGHYRLAAPLLPVAFACVALAFLLVGDFSRRGQMWRVMGAVGVVLVVQAAQLSVKNLGEKVPAIVPLIYLIPLVPLVLAAAGLAGIRPPRRRAPAAAE